MSNTTTKVSTDMVRRIHYSDALIEHEGPLERFKHPLDSFVDLVDVVRSELHESREFTFTLDSRPFTPPPEGIIQVYLRGHDSVTPFVVVEVEYVWTDEDEKWAEALR